LDGTMSGGTAGSLLDLDDGLFQANFNVAPFLIGHRLVEHELFRLPRLIALATTLPAEWVEYNAGDLPLNQDPRLTPRNGLSVVDTIERIETCRSWMVLKRVEQDPEYAALLHRCLAEIAPHSDRTAPGMTLGRGFVFISSPGSITPYHMDPEYNFLLQVRGTKAVHVLDGADRAILSEPELEAYMSGGHRNLTFREAYRQKASGFALEPGVGLHIPVTAPHWVENGPEVSISFSITFVTPASDRRELVYAMNARLRRLGIDPLPYARAPWRDSVKLFAAKTLRRLSV